MIFYCNIIIGIEIENSKVSIQFLLIFRQSGDVLFFLYARRLRGYTATHTVAEIGAHWLFFSLNKEFLQSSFFDDLSKQSKIVNDFDLKTVEYLGSNFFWDSPFFFKNRQ